MNYFDWKNWAKSAKFNPLPDYNSNAYALYFLLDLYKLKSLSCLEKNVSLRFRLNKAFLHLMKLSRIWKPAHLNPLLERLQYNTRDQIIEIMKNRMPRIMNKATFFGSLNWSLICWPKKWIEAYNGKRDASFYHFIFN